MSTTASTSASSSPAQESKPSPDEAPKTGLKKPKKTYSGEEVSRAFERGAVTLAGVIGVTDAQRDQIKNKAFTLLRDHRDKDALPLLQGLVALDPFDVWVLTALAALQIDAGALPLARALLARAAEIDAHDAAARALLAEVKFKEGDVDGARADVVALAGSDVPAVRRVRSLLEVNGVALTVEPEPVTQKMTRPASATASSTSKAPQKPAPDPVTAPSLKRPTSSTQNPVTNTKPSTQTKK